jgi:predicted dehydrogenase
MSLKPVRVGVIGCGNIFGAYATVTKTFPILELVAVADIVRERAEAKAEEYDIPQVMTPDELLADPNIDFVLNLTIPAVHGEIALKAVEAGKHVYNEKPFAPTREEGLEILAKAGEKGLLVGGAPDTFLGAGLQTCRKVIDDDWIGEPVAATAFCASHGHERWHPDPEFFYKPGAGPMFDMGPYYITALVSLVGPVKNVASHVRATFPERVIRSEPKRGEKIQVETPTHLTGTMEFESGAIATVLTSFDIWAHTWKPIEIHGTTGSMIVPDPNTFGGEILVKRDGAEEWASVPHSHGYPDQNRSIGLADMAYALRTGRKHRASGELTYHVLDVMHAFLDSASEKRHIEVTSTVERPAPMPMNLLQGELDT